MTYPIFIMPHRHFKKRFSERGGRKWVHDFAVPLARIVIAIVYMLMYTKENIYFLKEQDLPKPARPGRPGSRFPGLLYSGQAAAKGGKPQLT
jgi:hypothetical protein